MRRPTRRSGDRSGAERDDAERGDSAGEPGPVGMLHGSAGNQAVKELYERGDVQPKLAVSRPGDPAEREAERTAERVVDADARDGTGIEVARRATGNTGAVDDGTEARIRSAIGGGKPLPDRTQSFFESQFGSDFSDVRVHTGSNADAAARSIDAEAFTLGSDIVFRSGAYQPGSGTGRELLAHELTHVVQQAGGRRDHSSGGPSSRAWTIHRQQGEPSATDGEQAVEEGLKHVKTINNYTGKAVESLETVLVTLQLERTNVPPDSEAYERLTKAINRWSDGIQGIQNLADELGKAADAAGKVGNLLDLAQSIRGLAQLTPDQIRDSPVYAANVFENLIGSATSVLNDWLPKSLTPLKKFVEFFGMFDSENFFVNMAKFRKEYERGYGFGSAGATEQKLREEFNKQLKQSGGDEKLQAPYILRESAVSVAKKSADVGLKLRSFQMALELKRKDESRYVRGNLATRYRELEDALDAAIDAWAAYQEAGWWDNESAANTLKSKMGSVKSAWKAFKQADTRDLFINDILNDTYVDFDEIVSSTDAAVQEAWHDVMGVPYY